MKDIDTENKQDGRRRPEELLPSYTPKQRKVILKGLRILARAAIRVHMERRWPGSTTPPDGGDRVEGGQADE